VQESLAAPCPWLPVGHFALPVEMSQHTQLTHVMLAEFVICSLSQHRRYARVTGLQRVVYFQSVPTCLSLSRLLRRSPTSSASSALHARKVLAEHRVLPAVGGEKSFCPCRTPREHSAVLPNSVRKCTRFERRSSSRRGRVISSQPCHPFVSVNMEKH
jgi:hypothetical protein